MDLITPSIFLGVFIASLTGSLHCVGMCGGLMVNTVKSPREQTLYHFGRLIAYLGLGGIAGYLGEAFFSSESLRSFQLVASLLMGGLFLWMGFQTWNRKPLHLNLVPQKLLLKLQAWSLNQNGGARSLSMGALTGLLPCGWLHTFVIAAMATHSPAKGAVLLGMFWLGTVPALVAFQITFRKISAPLNQYSSKIIAVVLLGMGVSSLFLKSMPLLQANAEPQESCPFHSKMANPKQ